MFLETQILDWLAHQLKEMDGKALSDRVLSDIHHLSPCFQRLVDENNYSMQLFLDENSSFVVQFSYADDQIYTTYVFRNVFVAKESDS